MNQQLPSAAIFRDTHIAIARMFAIGMTPNEIRRRTGYSLRRLSRLYDTPAFQDLIARVKEDALEDFQDQNDTFMELSRDIAMLCKWDQYEYIMEKREMGEHLPIRESHLMSSDYADRFGYSKRSEVQHNHSFAELLDKAIERSNSAKLINGETLPQSGVLPVLPSGTTVVPLRPSEPPRGGRRDFRRV